MILIEHPNQQDTAFNLAMEEFLLRHLELNEDHLLFYINDPSIIIGKHQNTHEEINHEFVESHKLNVVRRLSGGGAVYHDHGNLNFSILTPSVNKFNDFQALTRPIVDALNNLNIPAQLSGRNDIVVGDRKVSGNAQYRSGNKMFCHGTLLFNSNLEALVKALRVGSDKIQSKGIQSIRSRVANLNEFCHEVTSTQQFQDKLAAALPDNQFSGVYQLTDADQQAIQKLADDKYRQWKWNFGRSPQFNVSSQQRFDFGKIDIRLNVDNSQITECHIFGDFFTEQDIAELEKTLTGIHYDLTTLRQTLNNHGGVSQYWPQMDDATFLKLLI